MNDIVTNICARPKSLQFRSGYSLLFPDKTGELKKMLAIFLATCSVQKSIHQLIILMISFLPLQKGDSSSALSITSPGAQIYHRHIHRIFLKSCKLVIHYKIHSMQIFLKKDYKNSLERIVILSKFPPNRAQGKKDLWILLFQ